MQHTVGDLQELCGLLIEIGPLPNTTIQDLDEAMCLFWQPCNSAEKRE